MSSFQRALLTGATGFVGSHLARRLVGAAVEVHTVVRPAARLDRIPDIAGSLTVHVDDGTTGALAAAVAAARPDVTFHLATNFVGEHGPDDVAPLVADNVTFPARLADALADGGARPFVNVGTGWQHVAGATYRPKNLYAATKQAFADVLRFYSDTGRLAVVTVHLYDTYGPLDHRRKLVTALLDAARTGATLDMTSGVQLIDLVHVDDVTRALVTAGTLAVEGPPPLPSYALSSGRPRSLRELVGLVGDVAGRPVDARWGARPDRAGEMTTPWWAGPPLPGWVPEVGLADGLRSLLEGGGSAES